MDIIQYSVAPPPKGGMDAQTWFGPPSPYRSLDILTLSLKVQSQFPKEFRSIKRLKFLGRAWVGS